MDTSNMSDLERRLSIGAGVFLGAVFLTRSSLGTIVLGLAAAELLRRGLTGHSYLHEVLDGVSLRETRNLTPRATSLHADVHPDAHANEDVHAAVPGDPTVGVEPGDSG